MQINPKKSPAWQLQFSSQARPVAPCDLPAFATIMPRKRGRPPKRRAPKYRLGKAAAMPGPLWNLWLVHVLREGPTWLHVALMLTHMLCLRITEVLRLRARDFNFKTQCVFIAPLKRGTAAWKHLLKPALAKLRLLKAHGVNRKRSRSKGMWGRVTFQDKWVFPREPDQLLFPALRADCNTKHNGLQGSLQAACYLLHSAKGECGNCHSKHPDSLWPASHGE